MLSYNMKDFWNMVVNFMNQCWDKSLDFLSRLNAWIPLSAVLIAGAGLVALVLILALCGCAVRKCLIPHWLIWTYFAFAVIIIFAHTGNNLAAIVSAIEIPFLIVLVCYILRTLFRRRPRYTYVEKTVYARELAKGRVYCVKNGLKNQNVKNDEVKELKEIKKVDKKLESEVAQVSETESHTELESEVAQVSETESHTEAVVEDEIVSNDVEIAKMEADAEAAKLAAAEQAAREAHEQEKAQRAAELAAQEAEQAAREAIRQQSNRVDKNDFYNVKTVKTEAPQTTSAFTTIDLPNVQPIPDKSYEPTREPTIVTKPVSQRIPDLQIPQTPVQSRLSNTSVSRSTAGANFNRPTVTTTTGAAQAKTTSTTNAFTSMYNPRIVKTTTTTATTNNSPLSSVTTNRTVNSNPVSSTTTKVTSNGTTPHSTDDIMAAIERLRASMKK